MSDKVSNILQIMSIASESLKQAAEQYGPQAVDLGLTVYRVSAFKTVSVGFLLFALSVGITIASYKFLTGYHFKWVNESYSDRTLSYLLYIPILGATILMFIFGVSRLMDFYAWIAVFGHPEVLITAKALMVAGAL